MTGPRGALSTDSRHLVQRNAAPSVRKPPRCRAAKRRSSKKTAEKAGPRAELDYRAELWRMADALHGSMDAAEYKGKLVVNNTQEAHPRACAELARPFSHQRPIRSGARTPYRCA